MVRDILLAVARKIPRPWLASFCYYRSMAPPRTSVKKFQAVETFLPSAPSRNRTYDPLLKRQVLYQLSYGRNADTILEKGDLFKHVSYKGKSILYSPGPIKRREAVIISKRKIKPFDQGRRSGYFCFDTSPANNRTDIIIEEIWVNIPTKSVIPPNVSIDTSTQSQSWPAERLYFSKRMILDSRFVVKLE